MDGWIHGWLLIGPGLRVHLPTSASRLFYLFFKKINFCIKDLKAGQSLTHESLVFR